MFKIIIIIMKLRYFLPTILLFCVFLSSCDDFLNQPPDNRVEWNSPEQITDLLLSAYSYANPAMICELSSDNFVDNNSPGDNGIYYNLASRSKDHDEAFAWKDIVSAGDQQDSPTYIWGGYYYAIAVANNALEAIKKFEDEGRGSLVSAQKGEALLCRAFHHFMLVNIFAQAYRDDVLSKNDVGIPYVTEPETKVFVNYKRLSVAEVYDLIQADLEAGIGLIQDDYEVPKYHFNTKAAHAFAARFYLFKRDYDKVIMHANKVLGAAPQVMMRNWDADTPTAESIGHWYVDSKSNNNLMLIATNSWMSRVFNTRYSCSKDAGKGSIYGAGPTWTNYNFHPCYSSRLYYRGDQEYGLFFMKTYEFFEYSDKIAGIGFGHIVRAEFTAEEVLLSRAEAYVYKNQIADAIADLKVFDDSRKITQGDKKIPEAVLTQAAITNFYKNRPLFVFDFHNQDMSPSFTYPADSKPILDCILHFRRLETIFDGMRWFDIKRYGIEITHRIGLSVGDVLKWDDPRRALQLPPSVTAAGMDPNERIRVPKVLGINDAMKDVFPVTTPYLSN